VLTAVPGPWVLVASALLAAAAGWLACAPSSRPALRETERRTRPSAPAAAGPLPERRLGPVLLVAGAVGAVVVVAEGETLAAGLVLTGAAAGAWRLVTRARVRRAAQATGDRVVEACEALAGELRAGQTPMRALRHCVEVWPPLAEASAAGDLGSDVPGAMRRLARLPGAAGMREVADAWQVSQRSGGTMAPALGRVADSARRRRATDRLVASELASAQATARLVAVLPLVVLGMGSGLGGDPWGFLLTSGPGIACLGAGLGLAYCGLSWIERIAIAAGRR